MNTKVEVGTLTRHYTETGDRFSVKVSVLTIELPSKFKLEAEFHLGGSEEVQLDLMDSNPITDYVNEMLVEVQKNKQARRVENEKRKRKEQLRKRSKSKGASLMDFTTLLQKACASRNRTPFMGRLLALDPGETTGWAWFDKGTLERAGQLTCVGSKGFLEVANNLCTFNPSIVICEDYRVYSHKSEQHIGSTLYTPRLIGAVEFICADAAVPKPVYLQMAGTAKGFCSDAKLKEWGFWSRGERHARDAIRHGCYWLLFGKED